MNRIARRDWSVLLAWVLWWSVPLETVRAEPAAELNVGEVLDSTNWQKVEGLLPEPVLEHYKKGEYVNRVVAFPEHLTLGGQDFLESIEKNRGKFTLDAAGTIIDKATGRQPPYVIGFPFPDIDPQDPQAAVKIIWNYFYQLWYNGNIDSVAGVDWLGAHGLDRRSVQRVRYLYYDAQPREMSPAANPQNLLLQFLAVTEQPIDVYGTSALAWRFRDGDKQDNLWAYVPALRRVRMVSPANRSDGFLGSDMSQDDGPFFDGKPQDFTWKLVGEAEMLVLLDPDSLSEKAVFESRVEGAWRTVSKDVPRLGYELPGWKGAPWAPISQGLAKRKVWIIEATPKDKYYLYGTIRLIIEKETFEGRWNVKFDWKGELSHVLFVGRGVRHPTPDGKHWKDYTPVGLMHAENVRMGRATAAGRTLPGAYVDYGVKYDPSLFEYQELLRVGK